MTAEGRAPVYFFWGDEFLIRKEAEELVRTLLPEAAMGLNYAVLDGASVREVALELATSPLFPGKKVVLVRDPDFVLPKKGKVDALGKAKEAWRAGRRKESARRTLSLLARAGVGVAELGTGGRLSRGVAEQLAEQLGAGLEEADVRFLQEVAAYCQEERMAAADGDVGPLLELLKSGVPEGHVLILAASEVDAKNPLVKWIVENGRFVEREVAVRLKDLDLSQFAKGVLGPLGKRLSPKAEVLLKERCGGNMRLVQSELEKLALFAEGGLIEPEHVELLVARVREEAFFELSEALQKRDLRVCLKHVGDALEQGSHPLQLLGAIASAMRTLLETSERMREWALTQPPRSFDEFKSKVFPKIEAEAKLGKQRVPHPYAAFMSMQAAGRFPRAQLVTSLVACAEADLALKSSQNGPLVLERLLWTVTGAA